MTTLNTSLRALLLAAPAALIGGAAMAGGLAEPIVVVEPAPVVAAPVVMMSGDWTGFYAGGQLGYGTVDEESLPDDFDFNGATYGVHAGYLYDFGSIVAGAEVDYDATNIESDEIDGETAEVDSIARAKLIVGYDAGALLPYLTGGVAQATLSSSMDEVDDTGTFLGGGVAYQISDNFRIGGEVLAHQFDDFDDSGADFDVTTASLKASFSF